MNITILGRHGCGKSVLGDIAKNTLFRMDSNATIKSDDPDREAKSLGSGNNVHNISVRAVEEEQKLAEELDELMRQHDQDVVVIVNSGEFIKWFRATQEGE